MKNSTFSVRSKGLLITFLVSASMSAVVAFSTASEAFWSRQDGSDCRVGAGGNDKFTGGCNISSAGGLQLECPIADSSTHPKASITRINVHIEDNSPAFGSVSRCVSFWNVAGGNCGSSVFTSNGVQGWSPPTFAGWTAPDFGYINVVLPPPSTTGGFSCIQGYFAEG